MSEIDEPRNEQPHSNTDGIEGSSESGLPIEGTQPTSTTTTDAEDENEIVIEPGYVKAERLLAEGEVTVAERIIRRDLSRLEREGSPALFAEGILLHAITLARLGKHDSRARTQFANAMMAADVAGDPKLEGQVYLSIIEEMGSTTSLPDLIMFYNSAVNVLQESADMTSKNRLVTCSQVLIKALTETGPQPVPDVSSWENFSLKKEMRAVEKRFIQQALRAASGSVTKAAKLLGFRHHQSLIFMINGRHTGLLEERSQIRKRRKHIISKPRRKKSA